MKNLFVFMLITLSLTAFANRESGGRRAAAAVFINFTSFGSGIDGKTFALTDKLIKIADKNGLVKKQTRLEWGREGEITICVHFQGGAFGGASHKSNFIKEIAPSIIEDHKVQKKKRTAVLVGLSCDNIKAATSQDLSAFLD